MHDQVRIAPNGRGEVGIAAEVEAEMSVIFGGVFGLRLGTEHHFVDELIDIAISSVCRNSRSALTRSIAGSSWTRKMSGTFARSSVSAAATFARIMNSSISRWASRRSGVTTRSTVK